MLKKGIAHIKNHSFFIVLLFILTTFIMLVPSKYDKPQKNYLKLNQDLKHELPTVHDIKHLNTTINQNNNQKNIQNSSQGKVQNIHKSQSTSLKIFSPDWGIISTLIAMKHEPYAMGEIDEYAVWVTKPELPNNIKDVGLRYFPNMEMLRFLDTDLIIDSDYYQLMRPYYPKGNKNITVNFDRDRDNVDRMPIWSDYRPSLLRISKNINPHLTTENEHNLEVERYIKERQKRIQDAGSFIKAELGIDKKYAVVYLSDTKSLTFTTDNSATSLAMHTMKLPLVFEGKPSKWGSSSTPIDTLFNLPENTCLIIKEPITPFFKSQLQNSLIWQSSRFSKKDACIYTIKSSWNMSAVEATVTFAENLARAIKNNDNKLRFD